MQSNSTHRRCLRLADSFYVGAYPFLEDEMKKLIHIAILCGTIFGNAVAFANCSDGIDNDGDGHTDYPADPGCYDSSDVGESNPDSVGGVIMPSLQDERDTYSLWNWAWTASDEPNHQSAPDYVVANVDVHGSSEGDDLWSYIQMYLRTNQRGYLDRARAWARYFKEDYRQCILGDNKADLCDETAWGLDHFYGWGLLAWYELTGDPVALQEAEALGAIVEMEWSGSVPGTTNMTWGSGRKPGRHSLFAIRLAAITGTARWITLRDKLIDLWMQSPSWASHGMYHLSQTATDSKYGAGVYDSGVRAMPTFHVGITAEAFYQAYLATGRADVRDRIVDMARFVDEYGLDPTAQMSGKGFGINIITGEPWHDYAQGSGFWDPVYTESLCNLLVLGSKYSGDSRLYDRAKYFFNQGTKYRSNYPNAPTRVAPDNEVHHFVDSSFLQTFWLRYNKGELQYTYLLFDPQLRSAGSTDRPSSPTNLTAN